MDSYRQEGASHLIQVRDINREMLEKALALRCSSYLADVKAAVLVRTVTCVGQSKRFVSSVNGRLAELIVQLEAEAEARREAEVELRRITQAVDQAPIMVALFARTSRVYANHAFAAAFELADPVTCVEVKDAARIRAAISTAQPLVEEIELRTEQGSFWGRVRVSPPLHGDQGALVGLFIEDVTKEREVAEQLQRSQRLDAIGQLTGGIAHDFNNALGVIQANAELLLEHASGPAASDPRTFTQGILDAVKHAAELTNQLLAFGRRQPLRPLPVDAVALITNLARMIRRTLGEAYTLRLELGQRAPLVLCDPGPLEAALLNLVLNARDASGFGGPITISLSQVRVDSQEHDGGASSRRYGPPLAPGSYLRISVRDEGSGIAPELVDRIWEPFMSTKSAGDHSGMGLSMVLGFAVQSGGRVDLDTELGAGTTVHLLLPRVRTREGEGRGDGPTVLLVEDEPLLRQGMALTLQLLGYRTFMTDTLEDAIDLLEREHVDCVMTDIVLANACTGLEVAEAARARHSDLPILFVSGYPGDMIEGFELPDNSEFIRKPFPRQLLAETLARLLGPAA